MSIDDGGLLSIDLLLALSIGWLKKVSFPNRFLLDVDLLHHVFAS